MQDKLPVSILMNCFNGEKYLREAIDSIIVQTYENWELIFWDNQSTDNSKAIFDSYNDDRLKYYYAPEHTVLYKARLEAIRHTSGKIIAFLDVDDWWYPEKLEKQIPLFEDNLVGFVYSNFFIFHDRKKKYKLFTKASLPKDYILENLARNYLVALPTLCIRKEYFVLVGGFNPKYHIIGDYDLVMRLANKYKAATIQEALSVYRLHDHNETNKGKELQVQELSDWIKLMAVGNKLDASCIRIIKQRYYYIKGSFLSEKHNFLFMKYLMKLTSNFLRIKLLVKFFKIY